MWNDKKIAVVIPTYRVKNQIMPVIDHIGTEVDHIFVVDDACPDDSGKHVASICTDSRVEVIYHSTNQGVGGATLTGMKRAIEIGADCIVKIDGDGQHDPSLILKFIKPIVRGKADYTKGNRFFQIEFLEKMPRIRLFGNTILSFLTKLSSGYWDIFDPTNGFIAIHSLVFQQLPVDKISKRYFFESDMLFRLYLTRAKIDEIPGVAIYCNGGASDLKPLQMIVPFLKDHIKNTFKRLLYSYFLRNFSAASLMLVFGALFLGFGIISGLLIWQKFYQLGVGAPTGMVVMPAVFAIIGFQFLIGFLSADMANIPKAPIHCYLDTW